MKIQGLASASRNREVPVAPPGRGRRQAARSTLEMGRFLLVGICYFVQIVGCWLHRQENLTTLIRATWLAENKAFVPAPVNFSKQKIFIRECSEPD